MKQVTNKKIDDEVYNFILEYETEFSLSEKEDYKDLYKSAISLIEWDLNNRHPRNRDYENISDALKEIVNKR